MEGFDAQKANDGQAGFDLVKSVVPDVVLLDIIMPKMDGITMLGKLREDEWGKNAKVIIFSNMAEMGKVASDLKEKGVYKYIVKTDINIEDLASKIKEFVG